MVTKVGVTLATHLKSAGKDIDVGLVEIICRVHDAFKGVSLEDKHLKEAGLSQEEIMYWAKLRAKYPEGTHETLVAAAELKEDYPEFAETIVKNIGATNNPCYLLTELAYGLELRVSHYADWRVHFENIISFENRLENLRKAYFSSTTEEWEDRKRKEISLEEKIFSHLDFTPDELSQIVANEETNLVFT
jgi:uncharacterized protein YnzC (UPF0291/DUF896 family)